MIIQSAKGITIEMWIITNNFKEIVGFVVDLAHMVNSLYISRGMLYMIKNCRLDMFCRELSEDIKRDINNGQNNLMLFMHVQGKNN